MSFAAFRPGAHCGAGFMVPVMSRVKRTVGLTVDIFPRVLGCCAGFRLSGRIGILGSGLEFKDGIYAASFGVFAFMLIR
jgi:hypothetical protein